MCPPDFFGVYYVINPWMAGNEGRARAEQAAAQWRALRDQLDSRATAEILPPAENLPDLVFTANAGLVVGRKVILSRFRFAQRRDEEQLDRAWFVGHRYEVIELPPGIFFEGAGDALLDRATERLWMGYGFRTTLEAAEFISHELNIKVIPLRLVDERFYHLDTCFAPLSGGYFIYFPNAFDERALRAIEELIPQERRFAVSERDALDFACNCVDTGRVLILNNCSVDLERQLNAWGFEVARTPLGEFMLAGGAAKCLCLRLDEPAPKEKAHAADGFARRVVALEGHLLDTGLLARTMDRITENGGAFETLELRAGLRREDKSFARIAVSAPSQAALEPILAELIDLGGRLEETGGNPAALAPVEQEGVAPEEFYSTTIYPTDVLVGSEWIRAANQRMDGVIVVENSAEAASARVVLMRDLERGQKVVVGVEGIRIAAKTEPLSQDGEFKFMSSEISSERRVETAVETIAWEMNQIRERGGKIVLVAGPVAVHTGGIPYLCELARQGYLQAVLAGNALAVHDIERALYGTSLGVDLQRGITVQGGHRNHLKAINTIRRCGSIAEAVRSGVLKSGFMRELILHGIPFSLAGSIRDDGPLPETQMDLIKAQAEYARLARGADMILMLSSMLHSIGVGNMTPSGVKIVCVDINPAVATKLADRGSVESRAVVTDVGLFLNLLVRKIGERKSEVAAG